MSLLRKLLTVFIVFILLCVIGVGLLMAFIDPNQLKPMLVAEVSKRTGYRLIIDGNLSWSFYPKVGVKAEHMILFSPPSSTNTPLLDAKNITIAMDVWSLIRGEKKLAGNVTISDLNFMRIKAQKVHVGIHWEDSVLTLQPINAFSYEGKLEGVLHGRAFATTPRWDWNVKLSHIALKPLLIDLNGPDAKLKIAGIAQVNFQATSKGKTKENVLQNLNGAIQFSLKEGVLEGIDLNYFVQSADALINKESLHLPNSNATTFDSLAGSAVITNGIASTHDLLLTTPAFTTKGEGEINLVNETMDYQLQIVPLHANKIKWTVPLLVTGDVRRPSVRLDMMTLHTLITKEQLEKVGKRVQEEIQKLPEKVDKFMQKFLGQ